MNPLTIITLPARLGYEVARRGLDVAAGVGRAVGIFGQPDGEPPAPAAAGEGGRAEPAAAATGRAEPGERAEPAAAAASPSSTAASNGSHDEPAPAVSASPSTGAAPPTAPVAESAPAAEPTEGPPRAAPTSLPSEDVELIRKVETEVIRDAESPEFSVDVNPIGGVVRLTGRAESADHVRELQRRALSVPGVKRVENELAVPDTPAPGPFNAERHRPAAEPLPKHLAESGKGRQPAPLGSDDTPPAAGSS